MEEMTQEQVQAPVDTPTPEVDQTATEETTPSVESPESSEETLQREESAEPKKQTRAERRINNLVAKLHERQPVEEIIPQEVPIIQPGDLENGIDPNELQRRIALNNQAESAKTRKQIKAELAYESAVNEHEADIKAVSENIDPRIERLAVRQYEAINYQINPFTGEPVFVPAMKLSEIVESIQADLDGAVSAQVAEQSKNIVRSANESALPGSDAPIDHRDDLMRKAMASGSDEDWKEVLKSRL